MVRTVFFIARLLEMDRAVEQTYSHQLLAFGIAGGLTSIRLEGIDIKTPSFGAASAVWTGISILGTVAHGIVFFHEPISNLRSICIFSALVGIIGLRFIS